MKSSISRLDSVDVARGVAALSVAFFHQGYAPGLAKMTGITAFQWLDVPISRLAVPLFFVISGFCIHLGGLARQDEPRFTRTFFVQRFFRIYPPWVSAVILSALVLWLHGRSATGFELFTHLTLINGFFDDYRLNPVLWSVSVESLLYLLYPLWLAFRRRHGLVAAFFLGVGVSTISSAITFRFQPVPTGPSMWFFLNVWCGWLAGAVLAEWLHAPGMRLLQRPLWWIIGVLAAALHISCDYAGVYTGSASYVRLPVTIMLCAWLLALFVVAGEALAARPSDSWLRRGWRLLGGIGLFSYSLYLIHVPLQAFVFLILPHLTAAWAKALLFAGWLGVVLAGSWLHYRWVEAPSIQWGRRVVARLRAAAPPVPAPVLSA